MIISVYIIVYLYNSVCIYNSVYTISKIDNQREFAVWLRKLKQGLCINPEGWEGKEDGREIQEGADICTPMAD